MTARTTVTVRYAVSGVAPERLALGCRRLAEDLREREVSRVFSGTAVGGAEAEGVVEVSVTVRGAPPVAAPHGCDFIRRAVRATAARGDQPLHRAQVVEVRGALAADEAPAAVRQ